LVASLSSACLFPSLDLTGGDAGSDATLDATGDTGVDASDAAADAKGDAAGEAGFTAGIGCDAATPDLLAFYTVDEGAGTIVHDCVSSPTNDGTILVSSHTAWVTGQHGKALEFDAFDGGCAKCDFTPSFAFGGPNAAPFTVALWLYMTSMPVQGEIGYIAGYSSNISAGGWRLSIGMGGGITFAVPNGSGGTANIVGAQIATGAWHHIAAVYAGASSALYVDGSATSGALPATWAVDTTPGDHMRIGCSADDQHPLTGRVDDVRFYNRALTAAEVLIVKNAN